MEYKELDYPPDVRLCVYHVGREHLDFHRHANIADITYCAAGELLLELPRERIARTFRPGQLVQVPGNAVHRVSHCGGAHATSTYVLLQLGPFSIDFVKDAGAGTEHVRLSVSAPRCYLGGYGARVTQIETQLRAQQPPELTGAEYTQVLAALAAIGACAQDALPETARVLAHLSEDRA